MDDRDLGKMWAEIRENAATARGWNEKIMVALYGQNGDNGIYGSLKRVESELEDIKTHMDAEVSKLEQQIHQPLYCVGKEALDMYIKEHDKGEQYTMDSRKLELDIRKSRVTSVLTLLGILASIIIALAKK